MKPTGDQSGAPIFYTATVAVSGGGAVNLGEEFGVGDQPFGPIGLRDTVSTTTTFVYVSDSDYVAEGGLSGTRAYLPLITQALDINRQIQLSPGASSTQTSWGDLTIANSNGFWNGLFAAFNVTLLPLSIGIGVCGLGTGYLVDPPLSDIVPMFSGVSSDWLLGDDTISISVDDATRYLVGAISQTAYGGSGGLDGPASLAGRFKPMARGGSAANPIRNVSPVLVDPVNFVYAFNDGPGTVTTVYVGGNGSAFSYAGDVADVVASSPGSGTYETCHALGLIRFGSAPVGQVTADVTGGFESGSPSGLVDLVKAILLNDVSVPPALIDPVSFAAFAATRNYVAGWFWDGTASLTGSDMIETLLAGLSIRLMTSRAGLLSLVELRAATFGQPQMAQFNEDQISTLSVAQLPSDIMVPVWQWRVGYQHAHTVQTATDLTGQVTADHRTFVISADRFAVASSATVREAYLQPGNPPALTTSLLVQADAAAVAADLLALWGTRRRAFSITVPRKLGIAVDLGQAIGLGWKDAGISGTIPAIVTAEQARSDEISTILQVVG